MDYADGHYLDIVVVFASKIESQSDHSEKDTTMHGALVIIPTYNERDNVQPFDTHVSATGTANVLVDDDSPDGTGALADPMAQANPASSVVRRSEIRLRCGLPGGLQLGPPRQARCRQRGAGVNWFEVAMKKLWSVSVRRSG